MSDVIERARRAVSDGGASCLAITQTSLRTALLRQKNQLVRDQARATRERSRAIRERSGGACEWASGACDESRAAYDHRRSQKRVISWRVEGVLEGAATVATWDGDSLECDWEIFRRAEVLVAMGETFSHAQFPSIHYEAALDGNTWAVLLTVLRALDRVTMVDVTL